MLNALARPIILAAALLAAGGAQADVTSDTTDVPTLIAAYHQAVTGHDGARLTQLFVPEGSAWFSVLSERALTRMRATKPETQKVRPGSVAGFVQMVSTGKVLLDPRHTNLHITSDGEIAAVTFDFRFFIDGKEQNRGAESWQLIHSAQGWRIVSIIFSSTPSAVR